MGQEAGELSSKLPILRIKAPAAHRLRWRASRPEEGPCLENEDETIVDGVFVKLGLIPIPAPPVTEWM